MIYITLFTVQIRPNIPGYVLIGCFSYLLNFFLGSKIFLAKLLMSYLKYYISLVSYKKSEKSNDWLPRNAQKCIFFTPISLFLAKIFFFKNPAPSVFRNHKKLPWYQKSENINARFERNLSGRTYGRTYECKSFVPL